jgi:hypothetical protein
MMFGDPSPATYGLSSPSTALGASNPHGFSSTPTLVFRNRTSEAESAVREAIGYPQQAQITTTRTLSPHSFSSGEYETDSPVDADDPLNQNGIPEPTFTNYGLVNTYRNFPTALAERPSLTQTFYEPVPAIANISIPLGQHPTIHTSNHLNHQQYPQAGRVLPMPHASLRPQSSLPARLNEAARSVTLPFHPAPTTQSRSSYVWAMDNSSANSSRASSITSESTQDLAVQIAKSQKPQLPNYEMDSASTMRSEASAPVAAERLSDLSFHPATPSIVHLVASGTNSAYHAALASASPSSSRAVVLVNQESRLSISGISAAYSSRQDSLSSSLGCSRPPTPPLEHSSAKDRELNQRHDLPSTYQF